MAVPLLAVLVGDRSISITDFEMEVEVWQTE
jgi:hypothetical protein